MASCVQYLARDGSYRWGRYTGFSDGMEQYSSCDSSYLTWGIGGLFVLLAFLLFRKFVLKSGLQLATIGKNLHIDIRKPPLSVPQKQYSKIDLLYYIRDRAVPQQQGTPPDVQKMEVDWGDGPKDDDDHTVELYLALSHEERLKIKEHGLNEEPIETLPLYSEEIFARIEEDQGREMTHAKTAEERASLRIEHRDQLKWASEQQIAQTVEYYLTYPYRVHCASRGEYTKTKQRLQTQVIKKIKDMLERSYD